VLIVGGGLGGVSAALTAARLGARVVLVEELDWLGGQLTAQGVPLDEHPWVELGVGSKSYLALRDAIREHYFRFYPITPAARAEHPFNPGMGNVGTLCCEPKVALRVIEALLGPYESRGLLTVMRGWRALAADVVGDRITSVAFAEIASGHRQTIDARIVVDATEDRRSARIGRRRTCSRRRGRALRPASRTRSTSPIPSTSNRPPGVWRSTICPTRTTRSRSRRAIKNSAD
jgi:phytoene dehydrogenase-like protein